MTAPWFLPEIHDLHPLMQDRIDALIALLPPAAVGRIAFSVVPDWQGRAPIAADARFAARLRGLPGDLVLHGFTHSLGPSLLDWLFYGHDNRSEFRALDSAEAARRLDAGLAAFAAAGLPRPTWFCAPRWQQSPATAPALAARGFAGWMTGGALVHADGRAAPLPALNFDEGERGWKIALAALPRRLRIPRLLAARRPFRFVLHPGDLDHPWLVAEIRALAARLADEGWTARGLDAAAAPAG
ncbi:MAG: DUF2334 domain-containing protein [Gemmobacter sp.]